MIAITSVLGCADPPEGHTAEDTVAGGAPATGGTQSTGGTSAGSGATDAGDAPGGAGGAGGAGAHPTADPDPLGTAKGITKPCEGTSRGGATCHEVTVQCPGVEAGTATVKLTRGAVASTGTVLLMTGGGGTGWYEASFQYGAQLVADLNAAGLATAQVAWHQNWAAGPGGFRKLGCRPATLFRWIYDELHEGGSARAFCATGNSGGSAQITYSLSRYGLGEIFDMVAPTSGPAVARLDQGCALCDPTADIATATPCGHSITYCLGSSMAVADETYGDTTCSEATTSDLPVLIDDSAAADGAIFTFPTTEVYGLFGGQDLTAAVSQGNLWFDAVASKVSTVCVPEAKHGIADSPEGYAALRDALIERCKLQ